MRANESTDAQTALGRVSRGTVLVVDDNATLLTAMARVLGALGFTCEVALGGAEALTKFLAHRPDVVLLDYWMENQNGKEVLEALRRADATTPVVVFSGKPTMDVVVSMSQLGVFDFLSKPVEPQRLAEVLERARASRSETPASDDCDEFATPEGLCFGSDATMIEVWKLVGAATRPGANANILLTGETGTGKTMLARLIHARSGRAAEPFVTVHCAGVPPDLLANELFGHEAGAYTGAESREMGRIEAAAHGTLLLDEIGELSPQVQVKLLRLLDDGEYERLGSTKTRIARCRIISATNLNLEQAMARNEFRADLYHRLSVVRIHVPSLRERRDDILPLARYFLSCVSRKLAAPFSLLPEAAAWLVDHELPGNVRQLRHLLEHAATVAGRGPLGPSHFGAVHPHLAPATRGETRLASPAPQGAVAALPSVSRDFEGARAHALEIFEQEYVKALLASVGGNVTRAAQEAGISRQYLQRLMKKHQVVVAAARADRG